MRECWRSGPPADVLTAATTISGSERRISTALRRLLVVVVVVPSVAERDGAVCEEEGRRDGADAMGSLLDLEIVRWPPLLPLDRLLRGLAFHRMPLGILGLRWDEAALQTCVTHTDDASTTHGGCAN